MKKLRIAVIGCGRIATVYKEAFRHLADEIELVFAVDKVKERAETFAAEFPGCAASDAVDSQAFRALLREYKPDLLHILLPHHLHCPYALDAFAEGVNVLSEKPIAIRAEDAERMISAAKAKRCRFGVIYQNRYIDGVQRVVELREQGKLGAVKGAFSTMNWFRPASYYQCDWKGKWDTEGGGVVIDQAIHSIDLVRYMTGLEAVKVQGHTARRVLESIEVEDEADAAVTLENGAVYSFFAANYYYTNSPIRVEIGFENAVATLTLEHMEIRWKDGNSEIIDCTASASAGESYWGACHEKQLRAAYQALRDGNPLPWAPEDAKKTLEIVQAIYLSARINAAVQIASQKHLTE